MEGKTKEKIREALNCIDQIERKENGRMVPSGQRFQEGRNAYCHM